MLFKESIKRFTPPKGWSWASIGDVAKLSFSSVDKKSVEGESAVSLCNYMDVFYNRRIREGMPFMVSTASDSDIKKFTLNKGDVVLTKDSETPEEIAFAAVIDEQIDNLVCGYHLAVLRPDKTRVTGEYLMSAINFHPNHHQFVRLANGATRFGLGIDSLNNALLPIPPLAEQRKIAEILRTWDEAIETAEAELKAKQERKRGLVGKLVGACGELASHARSLWPLVALSNFSKSKSGDSTLIKGKLFKEPGLGLFPAYSATGQDVWRDTYAHDMTAIVVSAVGARCGRTFIACGKWSAIANTQVILPDLAKVEPYYLNLFLNDEKFWVRGGSAQPFVVPSKTLKKKIPLPPLAEQQKIVNILQDADADIELINERINALRTQKRGLMQKLLTGEVRVAA